MPRPQWLMGTQFSEGYQGLNSPKIIRLVHICQHYIFGFCIFVPSFLCQNSKLKTKQQKNNITSTLCHKTAKVTLFSASYSCC